MPRSLHPIEVVGNSAEKKKKRTYVYFCVNIHRAPDTEAATTVNAEPATPVEVSHDHEDEIRRGGSSVSSRTGRQLDFSS